MIFQIILLDSIQ